MQKGCGDYISMGKSHRMFRELNMLMSWGGEEIL